MKDFTRVFVACAVATIVGWIVSRSLLWWSWGILPLSVDVIVGAIIAWLAGAIVIVGARAIGQVDA
jgi:hypothetical protein